ncbi:ankyrin repeat domain-containing protein [Streptomyces sp. RY43-2]|uniref:Ankyrin repeat domain-containing protein n=1 Tax=Streptomyces macrolidinus TaxID=2952607 RepID=A0ABT0Z8R6_9ACTN|nr:ankyrin repeat domain-containing protein [Streptomyces macrolidinus]MCN9239966.1 ankyrin repeat domain-containing protein [Streptomyces macrolidinus]
MNNRGKKKLPKWLSVAAEEGQVGRLRRILALGADPNQRHDGITPLFLASVQGELRCAALLLAAGASPNEESGGRRAGLPLAAAASKADLPMAELLLRYGADPLLPERSGNSALDWARGWEESVEEHRAVEELLLAAVEGRADGAGA